MANVSSEDKNVKYESCRICGRTFVPTSLGRHEQICEKLKYKQRNVFDSFRQRAKNNNAILVRPKCSKQDESRKSRTKLKVHHGEHLKTIRNGHGTSQQKSLSLDYTQCPVCQRCFNHKAADRHINWCKEQLSRLPKSPASTDATMRLKARVQYRAPLPTKKWSLMSNGQRLVKSAESCKTKSVLRTHSSPCASVSAKRVGFELQIQDTPRRKSCERMTCDRGNENCRRSDSLPNRSCHKTTAVKFKEHFTSYNNIRKSHSSDILEMESSNIYNCEDKKTLARRETIDILWALRNRLEQLQMSDSFDADQIFPTVSNHKILPSREVPSDKNSNEYENNCNGANESEGLLPSVDEALPLRMPRFCYECGTKYPVVSAKYCCECGTKRLILSPTHTTSA